VPGLIGQAGGGGKKRGKKPYIRAGKLFSGCVPKLSINFEEILSCVHGNSEEQNKFFKSAINIIYYCIIIINAYVILLLMHNIIIIFLIKAFLRHAIGKKMLK